MEDPRLLTGAGQFVDDLRLPRMVHVAFVRSPHAHARITAISVERAGRLPGVVAILTGEEAQKLCKPHRGILLHYKGMKTGPMMPLAVDRVRYAGEPVIAVAATERAVAEDACDLIQLEYQPLPALLDPEEAVRPEAVLIHEELGDNIIYETTLEGGTPDVAFREADRVYRQVFRSGRHTGVPIEPRGLVASFEPPTRAFTLWISSQVPHMMQAILADLLRLEEHRVRVITPDVGGSFGIKIHIYQDDLAACCLALRLGRPVKFIADRRESFLSDIHARDQTVTVDVAAKRDGTLTGMRAKIIAPVGPYSAYPRTSVVEGGQVLRLLPGPYRIRNYSGHLQVVAQNLGITSQYRAVGHPIAATVTEAMLEIIARDLKLDPVEVRRRNLIRREEFPYASCTGNVYDSGSYLESLENLLQAADYSGLRREQAEARTAGRYLGIGLSSFVEITGPGAQFYGVGGAPISAQDGTTIRIEPSGKVTALIGVTNQGQGTPTAFAQIIADELGIGVEEITILSGDTGVVPYGGGTWASRGSVIGAAATLLAAQGLREKIVKLGSGLLEAHPDDIEIGRGRVSIKGSRDRGMNLSELARIVYYRSNQLPAGMEPSLEATHHYSNPQASTFTNGAHLAVVEVDVQTGLVTILRYVAVDDCGRIINPAMVEGQVRGGVVQGIGGALFERSVYDERGQLLTTTLMDYLIPTTAEIPAIAVHHLETLAPAIPGGFKGAGEAGTTGAPATILNAVNDALAPFGVTLTELPITPDLIRRALGNLNR
ncbi:MAG: xanthine dehydrogenase family protein molybdopterin-binding subunit [Candidatus Methylomirabilales bacterium]